jgi:hypothetical protein
LSLSCFEPLITYFTINYLDQGGDPKGFSG